MAKILITGAAGFMGSHLFKFLEKTGHDVCGVDNYSIGRYKHDRIYKIDLNNKEEIDRFIMFVRPDIVYHLAAWAHEGLSQFAPIRITQNNYIAYLHLLVPCIKYHVSSLVVTSSMSVYGDQIPPFTEDMPRKPEDVYAISKTAMEEITEKLSEVYKFKYVIVRPHNCYDDQTEVLTNDGFKFFKDLNKNELIATLNPKTNTLEYHKAYDWQKIPYNGNLLHFKSKSHDLMVTPEHKMWIRNYNGGGWGFETAKDIIKSKTSYCSEFKRYVENWVGKNKKFHVIPEIKDSLDRPMTNNHQNGHSKTISMELWCRFLGWYISEGSRFKTKMNYVISISQHKSIHPEYWKEIIELINEMGFKPYWVKDCKEIRIFSKQLYTELDRLNIGDAYNKCIPKEIIELDKKYLLFLFDTIMKGDGDTDGGRYTTVSDRLKEDFCELCLKIGKSITVAKDKNWRILITNQHTPQIGDSRSKTVYVKEVPYDGFVYDLTVPNHIIFVRRNGKTCWSSNCFGPDQNLHDPYRNVAGIFINRMLAKKPFYIYGDGNQKRSFSYIDDVTPYMAKLGLDDFNKEIFNIGPIEEFTINQLAEEIMKNFPENNHLKSIYLPERPLEVKNAWSDNTKAIEKLGYKTRTSFGDGIKKMCDWAKTVGYQAPVYLDELELDSENMPITWKDKLI